MRKSRADQRFDGSRHGGRSEERRARCWRGKWRGRRWSSGGGKPRTGWRLKAASTRDFRRRPRVANVCNTRRLPEAGCQRDLRLLRYDASPPVPDLRRVSRGGGARQSEALRGFHPVRQWRAGPGPGWPLAVAALPPAAPARRSPREPKGLSHSARPSFLPLASVSLFHHTTPTPHRTPLHHFSPSSPPYQTYYAVRCPPFSARCARVAPGKWLPPTFLHIPYSSGGDLLGWPLAQPAQLACKKSFEANMFESVASWVAVAGVVGISCDGGKCGKEC